MKSMDCLFPIMWFKYQLVKRDGTGNTNHEPIDWNKKYEFNEAILLTLNTSDHVVIHE